jgi:hypothetical protein
MSNRNSDPVVAIINDFFGVIGKWIAIAFIIGMVFAGGCTFLVTKAVS